MPQPRFRVFATPNAAQPPFDLTADVTSLEFGYGADGYSDPTRVGMLPLSGSIRLVNQDGRYSPGGAKPTQALEVTGVQRTGQTYATAAATDSLYTVDVTGEPTRVGRLRTAANQRLVFPHSMVWHNETLYVVDEFDRRFYSVDVATAICTATSVVLPADAAPRSSISVDGVLYAARGTLWRCDISAGTATNLGELQLLGGTPLGEGERLAIVTAMGEHDGTVYAAARLDNPQSPRQAYAFGIVDVSAVTFTWLANFPAQTEIGALSDLSYASGSTPEFVAWRFIDGWFWPINLTVSPPSFGSDRNGRQRITGATIARTETTVEETVDLWFTDAQLAQPVEVSVQLDESHLLQRVPGRWEEGARGGGGDIDAALSLTSPLSGSVERRVVAGSLDSIIEGLLPEAAVGTLGGEAVTHGVAQGQLPRVISDLAATAPGYAFARPDGRVEVASIETLDAAAAHATITESAMTVVDALVDHGHQRIVNEVTLGQVEYDAWGAWGNTTAFTPGELIAIGYGGRVQSALVSLDVWAGEEVEYERMNFSFQRLAPVGSPPLSVAYRGLVPGPTFGSVWVLFDVFGEGRGRITFDSLRIRRRDQMGDVVERTFSDGDSVALWGRRARDLSWLAFSDPAAVAEDLERLVQVHDFARLRLPLWQDTAEAQAVVEGLRPGQIVETRLPAAQYAKSKAVVLAVRYQQRQRRVPQVAVDLLDLIA